MLMKSVSPNELSQLILIHPNTTQLRLMKTISTLNQCMQLQEYQSKEEWSMCTINRILFLEVISYGTSRGLRRET